MDQLTYHQVWVQKNKRRKRECMCFYQKKNVCTYDVVEKG